MAGLNPLENTDGTIVAALATLLNNELAARRFFTKRRQARAARLLQENRKSVDGLGAPVAEIDMEAYVEATVGAQRVMPNYNVMGLAKASLEANVRYLGASLGPEGIRVNAISAGPIRTLAASGIKDFRKMLSYNEAATPLRRNVTIEEVGNAAAFLCSNLASGISGEILYVDGGFNTVAMPSLDAV